MNICISNLLNSIGNGELAQLFLPFGQVKSAGVVKEQFTGQSRGLGYAEMEDDEAAKTASEVLN